MRPKIVVFAVCISAMILSGCGQKKTAKDGIVLTLWETYNTEEKPVFLELVAEFEAAHPGVKIKPTNLPFMGSEPKILTALATRTTPDIARVDGSFHPKLATRGALTSLEPYVPVSFRDEIVPVALKTNLVNGELFGLPDQVNCLCLFTNKDLLSDAGYDPDAAPATWDDLITMGKKITDTKKGVFAFGMRNSLWWSLPFFNTYGAPFLTEDGTRCLLNEKKGVEAFQLKVDLYRKHKIEGGGWMAGGIRDDLGFQTLKYAIIFNGPWAVKSLTEAGIDFGVHLIPSGPKGTSTTVGGNNLVVFRSCKHPEAAAKFLMFIASKESQTKWGNALGQVPVNRLANVELDLEKHPYLGTFIKQMETAIARPQTANYPEIENAVNPEMQAALEGTKTVQQAMDSAVEEVNKILAEEREEQGLRTED